MAVKKLSERFEGSRGASSLCVSYLEMLLQETDKSLAKHYVEACIAGGETRIGPSRHSDELRVALRVASCVCVCVCVCVCTLQALRVATHNLLPD